MGSTKEVIDANLNNFQELKEDFSIQYVKSETIRPRTNEEGKDTVFFDFEINSDEVHFTRLSDLRLSYDLYYYDGRGQSFTDQKPLNVGPINDVGKLLFSQVLLKINDQRASQLDFGIFYINFLHDFCTSKAEKETSLTLSYYYEDPHGRFKDFDCSDPNAVFDPADPDKAVNSVLVKRAAPFKKSDPVFMLTNMPCLALTNSQKLWPPRTKFYLSFHIAPKANWSMSLDDENAFSYAIRRPRLTVSRVKLNDALTRATMDTWSRKPMKFPVHYFQTRQMSIAGAATSFEYPNLFSGPNLPKAIIMAFIPTDSINSPSHNPLALQNPNLDSVTVQVGLQKFPQEDISSLSSPENLSALLEAYKVLGDVAGGEWIL